MKLKDEREWAHLVQNYSQEETGFGQQIVNFAVSWATATEREYEKNANWRESLDIALVNVMSQYDVTAEMLTEALIIHSQMWEGWSENIQPTLTPVEFSFIQAAIVEKINALQLLSEQQGS